MAQYLKQVSCKIDPEVLAKIDAYCKKRSYVKRNGVINAILKAVVECSSDLVIERMLLFNSKFYEPTHLDFNPKKKNI